MSKYSPIPLPPKNEQERRDREYGSQNMRMFYLIWQEVRDKKITGPSTEETRQRALVELVKLKRRLGDKEVMVNSYIAVAPNYYIYPDGKEITYELGFDLYFVIHVGDTERMYESQYRDRVAGYTRLNKGGELRLTSKFMPKGVVKIPLGRISYVDVDLKQCLGHIRAGRVNDFTCFDIKFSLDLSVQKALDDAEIFLEERFEDDLSEEEEENEW